MRSDRSFRQRVGGHRRTRPPYRSAREGRASGRRRPSVFAVWLVAGGALLNSTGCGLMIHGTSQDLHLAMRPAGTELAVYATDGKLIASVADASHGEVRVPRPHAAKAYMIVASKPGYCPRYWLTDVKGTVGSWGDILLLFPTLGLAPALDMRFGGAYAVEPDTYAGELRPGKECE
jgi:hypothetical protein